jgi:hypothetical protein
MNTATIDSLSERLRQRDFDPTGINTGFRNLLADLTPLDCYFSGATSFFTGHAGAGIAFPALDYGAAYYLDRCSQRYADWKAFNLLLGATNRLKLRERYQLRIFTSCSSVFDRNGNLVIPTHRDFIPLYQKACISLAKFQVEPKLTVVDRPTNYLAIKLARLGLKVQQHRSPSHFHDLSTSIGKK